MNYEKVYNALCARGKTRKKTRDSLLERHHILPLFFFKQSKRRTRYRDGIFEGDGDHIGNLTFLTPREHFIAHLLLCKIWRGTKWEYRCYTSVKMFLIGGYSNQKRCVFQHSSRAHERYKIVANKKISEGKGGTLPVKDAVTGERLGIVDNTHPKVLSGEWVHITKGMKKTDEFLAKHWRDTSGLNNSNSVYTDQELLDSYALCCKAYNTLVSASFWVAYSAAHNKPYIKFWKDFRFGGGGFGAMQTAASAQAKAVGVELKIITDHRSYEWREFVKKEKRKWESK
jgi:hypothetical protein